MNKAKPTVLCERRRAYAKGIALIAVCGFFACAGPAARGPVFSTTSIPSSEPNVSPKAVSRAALERTPQRITADAEFRMKRPAAGPERPFAVPLVKRFQLANGLSVILAESHKLPLVSLELVVKTGGEANPKNRAGLADLVANMLDEGTKTRTSLQIAEEIDFLGASLETGSRWDASSVSVSALTENIDKALDVWADVLLNPAFDEKELNRVRDNLMTEISRRKDSPTIIASIVFPKRLYGEVHPYAWPDVGTAVTIKDITPADLHLFYETYYRPKNAVLAAAGDITEAELRAKIEPRLSPWRPKAVPRVVLPKPPTISKNEIFVVDKAGASQSSIRIGLVGIQRKTPDYHKAMVMNHILGGGFKRLVLNLREQKGWTYGVSSKFEARRTPGPWLVSGEFVTSKTADAVAEVLKEMRTLRGTDVTDKELDETKNEIIKGFPARFSTVHQLAAQMVSLAVYGLPNNDLETFTKKIAAVTKADVRAMAQKYLLPNKVAIVVVGDRKTIEEPLRKLADVTICDADGRTLKP